jgi:hypothetical protein
MSETPDWNDASRDELRAVIQTQVLGEVRLAKLARDDILQNCCEACIEDECPAEERSLFSRFASEQLDDAIARLASEQEGWPAETDCDRLDRVEADLRDRGILLWQVSPCCDTCSGAELPNRIDAVERRHAGFRERVRGYAFFIDQNMADALVESTRLSIYLAYGWFSRDNSEVTPEAYEVHALGIAQEVCDCLREQGFLSDWDGSFAKKIGLRLNWQRRTLLA